jgi:ornithine carbamoyltransferase
MFDLKAAETNALLAEALELKRQHRAGIRTPKLAGRVLGLLFEKPSLRTRVSFEAGMAHLGGSSIFQTGDEVGLGKRESAADIARVTSTYVDLLAVRTYSHATVEELARWSACPVINALSDEAHPCQALADMLTVLELSGKTSGARIAFVGDGNNVARDLAVAAVHAGAEFTLAAPDGYDFSADLVRACREAGPGSLTRVKNPGEAVAGADFVYTDVWTSMGQEAERQARLKAFAGYQVDEALMKRARAGARFLHCLPARRGEEVSAEVIDGPNSAIVVQAENRLHAQKALMLKLAAGG